ncbi:hypothetical protein L6R50_22930 [Myxococcota bacterium]|nr:hypothetical protein [Myxococcota bacterium]
MRGVRWLGRVGSVAAVLALAVAWAPGGASAQTPDPYGIVDPGTLTPGNYFYGPGYRQRLGPEGFQVRERQCQYLRQECMARCAAGVAGLSGQPAGDPGLCALKCGRIFRGCAIGGLR